MSDFSSDLINLPHTRLIRTQRARNNYPNLAERINLTP